jgi:quercetin dioxygenase-like cupin family protein
MKQKLNVCIILSLFMVITILSCNEQPKKDEAPKTDVPKTETTPLPAYDPAMDPVKVEAAFNKVLADTLNVKLHEVTLNPGDSVDMHTHPDFTLYILQGGSLKIYPKSGEPQVLELKTGMGFIFPTVTHSGKNIGTTTIKLLVSDIYRPRS